MTTDIEVILTKNVRGLGKLGEKKRVKQGYARNFLLPKGFALSVNNENLRRFESIKDKELKRMAQEKADAKAIQKTLENQKVEFSRKVHDSGKLYGSVSVTDICEQINKDFEIKVEKKNIVLVEPIKELGEFDVKVTLHDEIVFSVNVVITEEEE